MSVNKRYKFQYVQISIPIIFLFESFSSHKQKFVLGASKVFKFRTRFECTGKEISTLLKVA
jgi:hypothetical protein